MSHTVIDHAISIPNQQEVVWEQIKDISKNPIWQADCEQVAFLTTKHQGQGARWRSVTANGNEFIVEVTAWYEGLGYEYSIVDGKPFQNNRGRLRLQELPEGTVVQWTFSYEMRGFLSGLRNSLTRRGMDRDIVDSLRNLYSYIKSLPAEGEFQVGQSKSLMRDALDFEARLQYQPRHPSAIDRQVTPTIQANNNSAFRPPAQQAAPIISEPPPQDEDTQPNPTVQTQDELPAVTASDNEDSQSAAHRTSSKNTVPAQSKESPSESISSQTAAQAQKSQSQTHVEAKPTVSSIWQTQIPSVTSSPPPLTKENEPKVSKLDSSQISVFDVFGLKKPSETDQMRAIQEEGESSSTAMPDVRPLSALGGRVGLRRKQRRGLVNLRLPN